jgi:hypothetical protein
MEQLAAVGGGAFILVSNVLGIRLLLMWWRTREIPELACGLGLMLMGGIGYPLMAVIEQAPLAVEIEVGLLLAQMLCHVTGNTLLCVFTQRVFRPRALWAQTLIGLSFALTAAIAVVQIIHPGLVAFVERGVGIWHWHGAAAVIPLLWTGAESLRYHGLMRRRQELGLADPLLTNRFRLWAVAMFSAALITMISLTAETLGTTLAGTRLGGLVIGSLGSFTAVTVWLAFLPPKAYVRRVNAAA